MKYYFNVKIQYLPKFSIDAFRNIIFTKIYTTNHYVPSAVLLICIIQIFNLKIQEKDVYVKNIMCKLKLVLSNIFLYC